MVEKNKCEGCGGTLAFNPDMGGLHCENCNNVKPFETSIYTKTKKLNSSSMAKRQEGVDINVKCESCGATLSQGDIIDTKCPYCGSTQINVINSGMEYIPDSIIPFAVSKKTAVSLFKNWIKKRRLAPNDLKKKANINSMKGIYLPCWLYDYDTYTQYSGIGVKEHRDSDGDVHVTRRRIKGEQSNSFKNQIEPASSALKEMSIEEFKDYTNAGQYEFDSRYILGFQTSHIENDVVTAFAREQKQKSVEIEEEIKRNLNYDRYENFVATTSFSNVMWSYTLLPVWLTEYVYKNKSYKILVNGKTGSIVGKAPKSGWKIFFLVLGIILGVGGIAALIALSELGII